MSPTRRFSCSTPNEIGHVRDEYAGVLVSAVTGSSRNATPARPSEPGTGCIARAMELLAPSDVRPSREGCRQVAACKRAELSKTQNPAGRRRWVQDHTSNQRWHTSIIFSVTTASIPARAHRGRCSSANKT